MTPITLGGWLANYTPPDPPKDDDTDEYDPTEVVEEE